MMLRTATPKILAVTLSAVLLSCSGTVYRDVYPTLLDGKYDSEFPYRGCSVELEKISESVRMLNSVAYYWTVPFDEKDRVRLQDINDQTLQRGAANSRYDNRSTSGTATIIYQSGKKVALLTCAHIIEFPDTVVSYFVRPDGSRTEYVSGVSIRQKQVNYVASLPEGGELEVLAIDRSVDVAILGREFQKEPERPLPVFSYPCGSGRELEWGSFVYLFGYPAGWKMVTKGIVSDPNRDKGRTFLVDAALTMGASGGIALAVRDGVPNFELVGLVRLVKAQSLLLLTPVKEDRTAEYDPVTPYTGPVYVEKKIDVQYGITQVTSIDVVKDFVTGRKEALEKKGFFLDAFFAPVQRTGGS